MQDNEAAGPGRPPLLPSERANKLIQIKVTAAEKGQLQTAAERARGPGRVLSGWIRDLAMDEAHRLELSTAGTLAAERAGLLEAARRLERTAGAESTAPDEVAQLRALARAIRGVVALSSSAPGAQDGGADG